MGEDEKTGRREDEYARGEAARVTPLQAAPVTPPPGEAMAAFLDAYYAARPVNATFTGRHAHDHRLPDWSAAGVERLQSQMRSQRVQLAAAGK